MVEDDRDLRAVVSDVLTGLGYVVAEAGNGREALDYLRAHQHPNVIVLDLKMPIMDGAEFCRQRWRDRALRDIPVLIFTATPSPAEVAPCSSTRILRKPLVVRELIDEVARAVQEPRTA